MCECTVCFSCRIVSSTLNACLVSIHAFIAVCDLNTHNELPRARKLWSYFTADLSDYYWFCRRRKERIAVVLNYG